MTFAPPSSIATWISHRYCCLQPLGPQFYCLVLCQRSALSPAILQLPGGPMVVPILLVGLTQRDSTFLGSLFPSLFGLDSLFIGGTPPVPSGLRDNTFRSSPFSMGGPLSCQCNVQGLLAQALPRITLLGTSMDFPRHLVFMGGSHMQTAFLLWCTAVSHMTLLSTGFPMCRHQLGCTRVSQVHRCVLWHMTTYVCPRPRM
jgi:hypothetical protein